MPKLAVEINNKVLNILVEILQDIENIIKQICYEIIFDLLAPHESNVQNFTVK